LVAFLSFALPFTYFFFFFHQLVKNLFISTPNMSEKDYPPLSNACFRALVDKMPEKRKAAALEVEK